MTAIGVNVCACGDRVHASFSLSVMVEVVVVIGYASCGDDRGMCDGNCKMMGDGFHI